MKALLKRLMSIVIAIIMFVGILPTATFTALAATNLEGGFEGMDSDVFSALGFDVTELPEGYDPETTDNPYGREKVPGKQVYELVYANRNGTRVFGKGNNKVDPLTISQNYTNNKGISGIDYKVSAVGDFDGDGLAGEIVYLGTDGVPTTTDRNNIKMGNLRMVIYDGKKEAYGTRKEIAQISPWYTLDADGTDYMLRRDATGGYDTWYNLMEVTAGDYDGDGISEIALYVAENGKARVDVYKYQKKSTSAEGDWINMENWKRVWSHSLQAQNKNYVPNMVSLASGDFNRDGVDDLGISSGSAYVGADTKNKGTENEKNNLHYVLDSSKAVILWGDRAKMLQNSDPLDLAADELGNQVRVSLTTGDLDNDGAAELIATGHPLNDAKKGAFTSYKIASYTNSATPIIVRTKPRLGNEQRTVVTYLYDGNGLVVNTSDVIKVIDGTYETVEMDGETRTSWKPANGFDQYYRSMPRMKTNSTVFFPEGAEYPYLYLDSCLIQAVNGTLTLTGEMDEKYDGENKLDPGKDIWAVVGSNHYSEFGASAGDINGEGYQILVNNAMPTYSRNEESNISENLMQSSVVKGTSDGKLKAAYHQGNVLTLPNQTFLDCDIDTVLVEYTGKHYLTYSDPKVLAVIAAAPYFKDVDLATGYEFAGNNTTSWAKTEGEGEEDHVTVSFSAGIYAGVEAGAGGAKGETELGINFTYEYEKSNSLTYEYTMTFGTYGDQDVVAFYSIPTENYVYRVSTPNGRGGYDVSYNTVTRTFSPAYQVLTLDYYESIQGNYSELPRIRGKAIKSTPGEPSSYPSSSRGYDVIKEWNRQAAGVGYGNGSIEQEIAITAEETESHTLGAEVTFKYGGGISMQSDILQAETEISAGIQLSLNPAGGWATTSISGTTMASEVANMPVEFQQYGYYFDWKLFGYYYEFGNKDNEDDDDEEAAAIGDTTSARIPVVSYIVNNVSEPPKLPEDFQQDYDRTTSSSNVLTWTYDEPCTAFIISKYFDFPVGGGIQDIARIETGDSNHYRIKYDEDGKPYKEFFFEDANLSPYTEYQYAIQVERLVPPPPLSTPSALVTARTRAEDGYPRIVITESDDEQDKQLLVYPDKNSYLTADVTGPEGQSIKNYYSVVQYQWQKKNKGAWEDMDGSTNQTLTFASAGVDTAGEYRCRVNVITKADNVSITAYSDEITLTHAKRNSYIENLALTDVVGGGMQLYAEVHNAHKDSAAIPGGAVTFNIISNATGEEYQCVAPLSAAGIALATVDQVLPEGMYTVEAYYSGSYIFKSCAAKTLYLSQRSTGYDIDLPTSVTYGNEAEIAFRKVTKKNGITSTENIDASEWTMFLAARLSRASVSGASQYTEGEDVEAGKAYYYKEPVNGDTLYFLAPVDGKPSFDIENGYALFGDNIAAASITPQRDTGMYLVKAGTNAGVYLISMKAENANETAYAALEIVPKNITLQIPKDWTIGEDSTEGVPDITFKQLSVVSGGWADCDFENGELKHAGEKIAPAYYSTSGSPVEASDVRKTCGSYTIIGTCQLPNYDITYRAGQIAVLGAAYDVKIGARQFDKLNVGRVYMISPEPGTATGPIDEDGELQRQIQAGVRTVYSAQPDDAYELYDWFVNGVAQNSKDNILVHTMMAEDTTIEAQFIIKQNALVFGVANDEGGTLSCNDAEISSGSVVRKNASFTFTAQAAEGYHFKEWRYTEQGKGTSYDREDEGKDSSTFDLIMPAQTCSLYAVFERDAYTFNYIDGSSGNGLTATYINDEGKETIIKSGSKLRGGTEITVAPIEGYVFDKSRRYASIGSQGTADYDGAGTYTLTLDEATTVFGWTLQEFYDLNIGFDLERADKSDVPIDAKINYIIDDVEYSLEYDGEEPNILINDVPGGSSVTLDIEIPGWIDFNGWTSNATKLKAGTEKDSAAVEVKLMGDVKKGSSYYYSSDALSGPGTAIYYFVAPINGKVSFEKDSVVIYNGSSRYALGKLRGDDTVRVHLKERDIHDVTLKDITGNGEYLYNLPDGAKEKSSGKDKVITVHSGDNLTVRVSPAQSKTVSYWQTTPEGGTAVKMPSSSLSYVIPDIRMNYEFIPIFSATTYNTISWNTIKEELNKLTLNPEKGYTNVVPTGSDFKFKLSGASKAMVGRVYANGNEFTTEGNRVNGTKYSYDSTNDVYTIENVTENQNITVSFREIGVKVNGIDISALSGSGWTYDSSSQVLQLSRSGLKVSGSNSTEIAPKFTIAADYMTGSLVLDNLNLTTGANSPAISAESNIDITAVGKNELKVNNINYPAISAFGDVLNIRGNGSLSVNSSIDAAADMNITGSVKLSVRTASKDFALSVGGNLSIGAINAGGEVTSAPTVKVVGDRNAAARIANTLKVYGGESSFQGKDYGIISYIENEDDGNVSYERTGYNLYGGVLEVSGGRIAFDVIRPIAYEYNRVVLNYKKGAMIAYKDADGNYKSEVYRNENYSATISHPTYGPISPLDWGFWERWYDYLKNSTPSNRKYNDTYYRFSQYDGKKDDTWDATSGLTLSVKYNDKVYSTKNNANEEEQILLGNLSNPDESGRLYYIDVNDNSETPAIYNSKLLTAIMNTGVVYSERKTDLLDQLFIAAYSAEEKLYFTRMKYKETSLSGGRYTYKLVEVGDDKNDPATQPLDYTLSGTLRNGSWTKPSNWPGWMQPPSGWDEKYDTAEILADGSKVVLIDDEGVMYTDTTSGKKQYVNSLTLDGLNHIALKTDCDVYLKGDNYLTNSNIKKTGKDINLHPLTAVGDLNLISDGTGTLTVMNSGDKGSEEPTPLNLGTNKLNMTKVASLTLISGSSKALKSGAVSYSNDVGTETTELPYGVGWLQEAGSNASNAAALEAVSASLGDSMKYTKFYMTSTDAKADPESLVYDKSDRNVTSAETEIVPMAEMGKTRYFSLADANDNCKVTLLDGNKETELSENEDYSFDDGKVIKNFTFNYRGAGIKDLAVGEYTLRIYFNDENTNDLIFYTLDIPLTVKDTERVNGQISAEIDKDKVTRGNVAKITTSFTGTTPKVYVWEYLDEGNNVIAAPTGLAMSLDSSDSIATITVGDNAEKGKYKVRVSAFADNAKQQELGHAEVGFEVVPKATAIGISCAGETPSGDESYTLYHNTLDGSTKTWNFAADVTMDDGSDADPDKVSWSLWGATLTGTKVDENGVLSIDPNETGLPGQPLKITATYTNEDGTKLNKTIIIKLSTDAIVGYEAGDDATGGTIASLGIETSGTPVPAGDTVTFTASPVDKHGVGAWYVNDKKIEDGDAAYTIGENTLSFKAEEMGRYVVRAEFVNNEEFEVKFEAEGPGIVTAESNGTITSGDMIAKGSEITFTAVPDSYSAVKEWTLNGVTQPGTDASLTIPALSEDVEVKVSFEIPDREVEITKEGEGSISFMVNGEPAEASMISGDVLTVKANDTVTVLAVPEPGYRVKEWKDLSGATAADAICTILPGIPKAGGKVIFEAVPSYTVTVYTNSYENGAGIVQYGTETVPMSGKKDIVVEEGGSLELFALADPGCIAHKWEIEAEGYKDYVISSDKTGLKLTNIRKDVTVRATFRRGTSELTLETEGNGLISAKYELTVGGDKIVDETISAAGPTKVKSGSKITVAAVPDAKYYLAELIVNGTAVEAVRDPISGELNYTIDAMVEDTVVKAVFEELVLYEVTRPEDYEIEEEDPSDPNGTIKVKVGSVETRFEDDGLNCDPDTTDRAVSIFENGKVELIFKPEAGYTVDTKALGDGVSEILQAADSKASFSFKQSADGIILFLEGIDKDLDFTGLESPFKADENTEYFELTLTTASEGTLRAWIDKVEVLTGAKLPAGTEVEYEAKADEHYTANVKVNGAGAEASGKVELTEDIEIEASFAQSEYKVTVAKAVKGSGDIKINGDVYEPGEYWFAEGTELEFEAVPAEGYGVESLAVDGDDTVSVIDSLSKDISVSASFVTTVRTVTYNSPANGKFRIIDAEGKTVPSGTSLPVGTKLFTVAVPNNHYKVETLTVGDTELTGDYFIVDAVRENYVHCEFTAAEIRVSWTSVDSTIQAQNMPQGDDIANGAFVEVDSKVKFIVSGKNSNYTEESFTVTGASLVDGYYIAEQDDIYASAVYKYTGDAPTQPNLRYKQISVKDEPKKKVYKVGEKLDLEGMTLDIEDHEGNHTTISVKPEMVVGFDTNNPTDELNVSIHFEGLSTTYKYKVKAPLKVMYTVTPMGSAEVLNAAGVPLSVGQTIPEGTAVQVFKVRPVSGYAISSVIDRNADPASKGNSVKVAQQPDGTWAISVSNIRKDIDLLVTTYKKPMKQVSGLLFAKMTASGTKKLNITWNSIKNADGYDVFFAQCNETASDYPYQLVKTVKAGSKLAYSPSGIKKGTSYKSYVKAFVMYDGVKVYVRNSPPVHAYSSNGDKKFTNAKSISVNKASVSLRTGKKHRIKATIKLQKKDKKLMDESHARKLRYKTSNAAVATVSRTGRVTARGKGTCYIYVYAHNGVLKKVKVTVK